MALVLLACHCAAAAEPVNFGRDIRPILSNNCFKCHGFDEKIRQAKLRLDTPEGMVAKLDSGEGQAVVPGNLAESVLVKRITSTDPDIKMPPPDSGKKLTPAQVELIKQWVADGGKWQNHWSFIPPVRVEPPAIKHQAQVRNPIDQLVLARLEKLSLEPAAEADKTTLVRRVTLDLTGLPPTPAEVDAFVADSSPDAYEKLVDRLLASPRYGEHMTRYWLDAVRYGDSHGLHFDNERSLWMYRDYVISSFNANKPFNQFATEQLAGDLLPNATTEQRIGSGFNRCNVSTSEGGSIDDEVLVRYAVDRTEAMSTVFLGLTVGCAVCHDHKFDPITQKEFYQLYAFYRGMADNAMDGNSAVPPPVMKVPTSEQETQKKSLTEQQAKVQQAIAAELAKIEYNDPRPDASAAKDPQEYVWVDDALPPSALAQGDTPWEFVGAPEHPVLSGSKVSTRTAKALSQHFFTGAKPGLRIGEGDKLFAYVYLDPKDPPKEVMLQFNDGAWEHRAIWGDNLIEWGAPNTPSRFAAGPLPALGQWVRLEIEATKVGLAPGAVLNGWAFTQFGGHCYWDKAGILTRTPQDGQGFDSLAAWAANEKTQTKSTLPQPVQDALKAEPAARNDAQKKILRDYFLENVYSKSKPTFDPLHGQVAALTKQISDLENAIPTTMVSADLPQPRDTFILIRGAYDKHGDKVEPGVPKILPPMPEGAPKNRLGLAQWIVDPKNPLPARVTVNRFWQQYFGIGLVKSANNFGAQGDWPSNPELLDWLATEFIGSGWNVKHLQKLIVMSGTYRQSSDVRPELLERDPENELLARGPRFRMDAEMVRDTALASSGLLVEKIGGRSVKPYQPDGVWEAVGFLGSTTRDYKRDSGEALYRRSMYTFWKRTAPPPSLTAFDAPSRETCTVRRARTNTPLQALVLMNDVQYIEAARRLAERMITEGGGSFEERATFGFRLTTGRKPTADELAIIKNLFQAQRAEYEAHQDAAKKLLAEGESRRNEAIPVVDLASWTMVAHTLLNLDETITKE